MNCVNILVKICEDIGEYQWISLTLTFSVDMVLYGGGPAIQEQRVDRDPPNMFKQVFSTLTKIRSWCLLFFQF